MAELFKAEGCREGCGCGESKICRWEVDIHCQVAIGDGAVQCLFDEEPVLAAAGDEEV